MPEVEQGYVVAASDSFGKPVTGTVGPTAPNDSDHPHEFITLHVCTKNLQSVHNQTGHADFLAELGCSSFGPWFVREIWLA